MLAAFVLLSVGTGFSWLVLGGMTGLDWDALSGGERWGILAAIGLPLLVAAGVLAVRWWRNRARREYLRDIGLSGHALGAHGLVDGSMLSASLGNFEDADGQRHAAWIVHAAGRDLEPLVVQPRRLPVPDYAAALPPVTMPGELAAWGVLRHADEIRALPGLLQVRVNERGARVLLERPLADPRTLRAALRLARELSGRPLVFSDDRPAPPPGALERDVPGLRFFFIAVAAWLVALIAVGNLAPDDTGYEDFILDRARRCPLVVEALGEPIVRRQLGWGPSTQRNRRHTSQILVAGPRGEGAIVVETYRRTRGTPVEERPFVRVVLGDIEVMACARRWKEGIAGPRTLQAGDCRIRVDPWQGFVECRVQIACDGKTIYGRNAGLGFADCWTVDDGALVIADPDRGAPRVEPTLELDERSGRVQIGDRVLTLSRR